jgi:hypothetical protein
VEWLGASSRRIDDVLHIAADPEGGKLAACVEWLKEFLADKCRRATEVYEQAELRGFSQITIRRAKAQARVFSQQRHDGWWNGLDLGEHSDDQST